MMAHLNYEGKLVDRVFFRYDKLIRKSGSVWYHLYRGVQTRGRWYKCDSWIYWEDDKGFLHQGNYNDYFDRYSNELAEIEEGIIGGMLDNLGEFCIGKFGKKEYIDWMLGDE